MKKRFLRLLSQEQGSVMVLVALALVVFIGFMALAVDTGHWFAVKNELQNASDAVALAGARGFYSYTIEGLEYAGEPSYVGAVSAAETFKKRNSADIQTIKDLNLCQPGIWNYLTEKLEGWGPINSGEFKGPAIRIRTNKVSGKNDGPVQNFFGKIFGPETQETPIGSQAIAALSGVGQVNEGEVDLPIVIGDIYVNTPVITLTPAGVDQGGWTGFFETANAVRTQELIDGIDKQGNPVLSPPLTANTSKILLQNGQASSVFIQSLLPRWDSETKPWYVTLPVVSAASGYNGEEKVLGFASFEVIEVLGNPHPSIKVVPMPGYVLGGAGGGGRYYGLMSLQPKLVVTEEQRQ